MTAHDMPWRQGQGSASRGAESEASGACPHSESGDVQMITCQDCVDFLCDYLEGELPQSQRTTFEEHIRICPPCQAYLQAYRDTIKLSKVCCCPNNPDNRHEIPEPLVQAILSARSV